jgi:hypothetical protein
MLYQQISISSYLISLHQTTVSSSDISQIEVIQKKNKPKIAASMMCRRLVVPPVTEPNPTLYKKNES